jgi:predicted AlkP superfamily phosphohydrolase/phosphomutase
LTKIRRTWFPVALAVGLVAAAVPAQAYIGPGAGFALLSSFLVVFVTILLAIVSVLTWPFRALWRALRGGRRARPWIKRLVIVGFDGQDPVLTDRFLAEGKLPHLAKLAERGCYHRLRTVYPSLTPAAWSTFGTGVQPAKHRIYDFLDRDPRTYLPLLGSTRIRPVTRFLKLGRWRIPLQKPEIKLTRGSKPFWSFLGEHHTWSTVLRVPITFPPDKFYGAELSAMCAPDLLGTQGTFLLFTTRPSGERFKEGGARFPLTRNGDGYAGRIEGPENSFLAGNPPMDLPLEVRLTADGKGVRAKIRDVEVDLLPGRLSDWLTITFRPAPGIKVNAICRMMLTEVGEHVSLYVTPLNFDPENPAMPISHPPYYSTYLAKRIGSFATLGLAEDTWALNEGVIGDGTFLQLAYDIDRERREMLLSALERQRAGTVTCVFDATDRIQHMFWRYTEEGHPAARGHELSPHKDAIEKLYVHNDALIGQVVEKLREGDLLMVLSDHGFTSFRRGVNLNAWFLANGYLALKPGTDGTGEWLRDVDWSRTRAYALGLAGLYLNIKGREAQGIVAPGEEAQRLKDELIARLSGLRDEECSCVGIRELFDTAKLYQGPYLGEAPDFIIGFNAGYRTSWDCATGMASGPVFEDNVKAWSGDHIVDPRLVPGIFFCSEKIDTQDPGIVDIAPTVLRLFGLEPPPHMDGRPLFAGRPGHKRPSAEPAPEEAAA